MTASIFERYLSCFFNDPDLYQKTRGFIPYDTLLKFVLEKFPDEKELEKKRVVKFLTNLLEFIFQLEESERKTIAYCLVFFHADLTLSDENKDCVYKQSLGNVLVRYILNRILLGFEQEYFSGVDINYRFLALQENPLHYSPQPKLSLVPKAS